jgi:predicted NAD/FAD-binding protein
MSTPSSSSRIAVIGAGVAGLTAAYILQRRHHVTLFEKNDYLGGHTHTVTVPHGPDQGTPVDTGFIVMNHRNYPLFTRLLEKLGVPLRDSEMSFGYWDERTGLQYSGGGLNGLFAQRRNLVSPAFIRMVREIFRFFSEAERDMSAGRLRDQSLGDYLQRGGYSEMFIRHHLVPMAAAIWSTPDNRMMEFPAESFVQFFHNHGLLTVNDRPQWRTVVGGSHSYVKRMLADFTGEVRLSVPIVSVRRAGERVTLATATEPAGEFDGVVVAAHADEALGLLSDPSEEEHRLLGAWTYQANDTVLHTDTAVMPPLRRVWSSWNYTRERGDDPSGPASLTYDMNRLQGLRTQAPLFVSLNRRAPLAADRVIRRMVYHHPTYSRETLAAQRELPTLNGRRRTWFCGSYFGYGFHEDAVRSAIELVRGFGLDL